MDDYDFRIFQTALAQDRRWVWFGYGIIEFFETVGTK